MLKNISIKNFALIDDLSIGFDQGLSAITGETGSGKSVLLEALFLIFGKRADADLIRYGFDVAIIEAVFHLPTLITQEYEITNPVTIKREIDSGGKNSIKLNQQTITLTTLKELGSKIGFIHSQSDTYKLMDKSAYLDFIDKINVNNAHKLLSEYLLKRSSFLDAKTKLKNLTKDIESSQAKVEYLTEQVKELTQANLVLDEKDKINERIEKLSNFEKIKSALLSAYQYLQASDLNIGNIYEAHQKLASINEYDHQYQTLSEQLGDVYYLLEEQVSVLGQVIGNFEFDDVEFDLLNQREYEITRLENKYKKTGNELIEYLEKINEELNLITNFDGYLKELQIKCEEKYQECLQAGHKLTQLRKKEAINLEKNIIQLLAELNLVNAQFKVEFIESDVKVLGETGLDEIDFLISLNEGEPLKSMAKVASGGEKARFMFSLRLLYGLNHQLSLLVFDEIDTGVSGKTAAMMANKMKSFAKDIQMLVVTHVPQVAAKADHNYVINKQIVNGRNTTKIHKIDGEEKILGIASMLSDDEISASAIMQAKALLR